MAERNSPTDGARFARAKPSGNHQKKRAKNHLRSDGKSINTAKGETLWTPEVQARIVSLIEAGNYAEVAARVAGISKDTFYTWLIRGGKGEQPFKGLTDAVEQATAKAEARDVTLMAKHAERHWQASAWRLERKNPKKWGRKDALELTGDEEKPIAVRSARVDLGRLTDDERETLMRLRDKMRVEEET